MSHLNIIPPPKNTTQIHRLFLLRYLQTTVQWVYLFILTYYRLNKFPKAWAGRNLSNVGFYPNAVWRLSDGICPSNGVIISNRQAVFMGQAACSSISAMVRENLAAKPESLFKLSKHGTQYSLPQMPLAGRFSSKIAPFRLRIISQ